MKHEALYVDIATDEGSQFRVGDSDPNAVSGSLAVFDHNRKVILNAFERRNGVAKWKRAQPSDIDFSLDLIERTYVRARIEVFDKTPAAMKKIQARYKDFSHKLWRRITANDSEDVRSREPVFEFDNDLYHFVGLVSVATFSNDVVLREIESRTWWHNRVKRATAHLSVAIDEFDGTQSTKNGIQRLLMTHIHREYWDESGRCPKVRFKLKGFEYLPEEKVPSLILIDHLCGIVASQVIAKYKLPAQYSSDVARGWHERIKSNKLIEIRTHDFEKVSSKPTPFDAA